MKAYVLQGINDLQSKEVEKPALQSNEVLIEVKAAGICGSDIPRIYKTGAHKHPLILGHEFSGVVKEVNEPENKKWLGKRVGVFPLIPCHKCYHCANLHFELCSNYSYLGSRRDGAFADYVVVPVENLIELPDNISFEVAAMLEPMSVAVHAIRFGEVKSSDTVAVCGLGTIGIMISLFLKKFAPSNILVIGNKDIQHKNTKLIGIEDDNFCDIRNQDVNKWIMEKTDGQGVEVFFECVGKNETISCAINNTKAFGNIVLLGNPYSDMNFDKKTYWNILRHQLTIRGSWNSSFTHNDNDDWHFVLKYLAENNLDVSFLISHRLSFEDLEKGLHIMKNKSEEYCKIMMIK